MERLPVRLLFDPPAFVSLILLSYNPQKLGLQFIGPTQRARENTTEKLTIGRTPKEAGWGPSPRGRGEGSVPNLAFGSCHSWVHKRVSRVVKDTGV